MTANPDTTIQIRLATEEDADLVRTLVLEFAAHQGDIRHVQATAEDWRASLARTDVRILLAFDRDYPIGYVSTTRRFHLWIASDIIALDDIYVRPDARNRGVGQDLMNAVAALAVPEQLTITWGARTDNDAAHRFYRRLGGVMNTKAVFSWTPPRSPIQSPVTPQLDGIQNG